VSAFFVIVCRKYDEKQDEEYDSRDDGKSVNHYEELYETQKVVCSIDRNRSPIIDTIYTR
jgi:hypothetical protein